MKVLVFGAGGQDGYYIKEECTRRGATFIGTSKTRSAYCERLDVSDFTAVWDAINHHHPDVVFQLAAHSSTAHETTMENHAAISTGTLNVLEAVYRRSKQTKVIVIGSAVQFENNGDPIDESTPFVPTSGYAVARIHAVQLARYYRSLGVNAYVAYLFHHDSPERKPPHMAAKIADAARKGGVLEVDDLDFKKEWTHAADTVRALFALTAQDAVHEAVIGTGEAHSIHEWAKACFAAAGNPLRISERVGVQKPSIRRIISAPTRILSTGWRPTIGFEQLAKMMVAG